ncbi:ABC transporter permease [Streptomyces adelaidensis]|uniref:ABC transporter permease n=1 Tax=Streptomyces adelaidensis TaxID=2796465 RepID=UPI001907CF7C|nr:ABC transporter permease [Streptomyces adelaidensis]
MGPVAAVVLWYVLSVTGMVSTTVLSSPVDVVRAGWEMIGSGALPSAIGTSVLRVLYGFLFGSTTAVALALIAGLFPLGEDLVDSSIGMLRTIPFAGLVPLFIVWFGIEETPKIALVALGVGFPLYFSLYGAVRAVDSQLIEAGGILGLNRLGLIRHVILPGSLPGALVGLRLSLGTAWLALVFAEQLNADTGIGHLMALAQQSFRTDVLVMCLATYASLGMVGDGIVRVLERLLLSWHTSFEGA